MTRIHIRYGNGRELKYHFANGYHKGVCGTEPSSHYLVTDPNKVTCDRCKKKMVVK